MTKQRSTTNTHQFKPLQKTGNEERYSKKEIFKKITGDVLIFLSYYSIFYIISLIPSSMACKNYVDKKWTYQMVLEDPSVFSYTSSFWCRIFGLRCDPNDPQLNPMQQAAMKIFVNEGDKGNYMKVIHEYSKEYFGGFFEKWFCNTDPRVNSYIEGPCPKTLRCFLDDYVKKCPNRIFEDSKCVPTKYGHYQMW